MGNHFTLTETSEHVLLMLLYGGDLMSSTYSRLTCENTVNSLYHEFCVFNVEAHRGLEFDHILKGAICTDTDSLLF